MIQSLVPQVRNQVSREELEEMIAEKAVQGVPHQEAMEHASYRLGFTLYQLVEGLWIQSEDIQREGLKLPFCMNSKDEYHGWNFSWGWDDEDTNVSNRSCFYTIFDNGDVLCREYPADQIKLDTILSGMNLACVIISDLLQSHGWDKEAAAQRLDAIIAKGHANS